MGDAGEGLIDAEARIQERIEDLERARMQKRMPALGDPEVRREIESLRLARTEFERQLATTSNARRRTQIEQALLEIDRRTAEANARLPS